MARNDYGELIAKWKVDLIGLRARRFGFKDGDVPDLGKGTQRPGAYHENMDNKERETPLRQTLE